MECDGSACRVNKTMHTVRTGAELTATLQLPSLPSGYKFSRVVRHRQDRRIKLKLQKDNYVPAAASQRMRVSQENWRVWQFTVTVHKAVRIIIDTFHPNPSTLFHYKQ
jgi:hypothetical protein